MLSGTRRRQRSGGAQWAALGLLLVVLGNLSLTTLTHDWIGALPDHDHLLFGARALGLRHHAHGGDPLDRALTALHSASPALTHEQAFALTEQPGLTDQQYGVVSLKPLSGLQPELNTYTALGLLAAFAIVRVAARRGLLARADASLPVGCIHAPPLPPPRAT